jgi:hypothetical protein
METWSRCLNSERVEKVAIMTATFSTLSEK